MMLDKQICGVALMTSVGEFGATPNQIIIIHRTCTCMYGDDTEVLWLASGVLTSLS